MLAYLKIHRIWNNNSSISHKKYLTSHKEGTDHKQMRLLINKLKQNRENQTHLTVK